MKKKIIDHPTYFLLMGFFIAIAIIALILAVVFECTDTNGKTELLIIAGVIDGLVLLMVLVYPYWVVDDKKIIARWTICKIQQIEWSDIERIELRNLERVSMFPNSGRAMMTYEESYVFISKTKNLKDSDKFANQKNLQFRIPTSVEIDEYIAKFYKGEIIDKRY